MINSKHAKVGTYSQLNGWLLLQWREVRRKIHELMLLMYLVLGV